MRKTLLLWLLGLIFMTTQAIAQDRTVTGVVTDAEEGEPLIGVSVLVKGTMTGTVTDIDGKYSITVPAGDVVLVFSYIGYATVEFPVTGATLDVKLKPGLELEETVVTALGVSKAAKALSYSSQKVSGDLIDKARDNNVMNSLSGRIAGVQVTTSSGSPGASTRLVLRGPSSITGTNEPLYVVDGVPMNNTSYNNAQYGGGFDQPNGMAAINADDIEEIQVLKSPSATAIYGIRAANGVILITTKKGKAGANRPIGVTLNSTVTFEKPLVLPDYQNSYGQGNNKDYFNWGVEGGGDGSIDESWGPPLDRGLEFVQWNSYTVDGKPLPWVSHPDNVKSLFNTGVTWNNSVAFDGATDKFNYRVAFGNLNQKGMIPFTEFNRYTVNANAGVKLTSKLSSDVAFNFSKEESGNLPSSGYNGNNFLGQTVWSARSVDFDALRDWRSLPTLEDPSTPTAGTPYNWNTSYNTNPFWTLENNVNKYNKNTIIGNVQLKYDINQYLYVRARTGINYFGAATAEQSAKGSYEFKDGFYRETQRNYTEINSELLAGYNQDFIDNKFNVNLNLGGNLLSAKRNTLVGTANGLELPNLYTLSNVKSGVTPTTTSFLEESKLNSIYLQSGLSWDRWIFVDFSFRNDWSSRLPKENNSFQSYAVGGSLILSDLINKDNTSPLTYLKVRGSWSEVGSFGALNPYGIDQTYLIRTRKWGSTILITDPATLNNPNLKAESTTTWEIGTELKLLKNRLRLDVTYYSRTGKDLLLPIDVSASTGYTSSLGNVASISNKGVEITFGATLLDKKDYSINVDFNWAKNKNTVESLGDLETYLVGQTGFDMRLEARAGQPYGLIVGHGYKRDDEGNIIHQNGLPVIDENVKVFGNIQPKWTGGVNLSFNIKGLTLSTLFDMKWGGSIASDSYLWGRYAGVLQETLIGRETGLVGVGVKNVGDGENPQYVPNDIVVSAMDYNHAAFNSSTSTEGGVFDASYIKWRQLSLSYNLPLKSSKIKSIGLGVVARNLMILYKKVPHIDPESAFSSDNANQGMEYAQLPAARSIGVNLNIKF